MVEGVRPELHRYCARLTGSVIEGEDIVQDTLAQGVLRAEPLGRGAAARPWLFRIAHNAALDFLNELLRRQRRHFEQTLTEVSQVSIRVARRSHAPINLHDVDVFPRDAFAS